MPRPGQYGDGAVSPASSLSFQIPSADVVSWRRHLHARPELAYEEFATAQFIEERLAEFGIDTYRPTPTAVVGTLTGWGRGKPRTIALRSDTDGLPVEEETGEPFSATNGLMHACGHDAHMAMLLGAASTLAGLRERFSGTVKFFFQPAEERNPGGAKFMVEAGVMEGVDRVFGLHVLNGPKATMGMARGVATSSAGGWFLTIHGTGGHGSMPDKANDPVICAAQVVLALNTIVSRNIDPFDAVVVNVGMIQAGSAPNVIPDSVRIGCSIRTFSEAAAEVAYRRADEIVDGLCRAYNCTYEFMRVDPYPVVVNDARLVDECLHTAATVLGGGDKVSVVPPMSGSEDFSEFSNVAPGVFAFLYAGDASDGLEFQNHHPKFSIVEDPTLDCGTAYWVQLVLDQLAG